MKAAVIGLLAETPVHPGSGRSLGVVDLPVAREAATEYPVLLGSTLKGALRDRATHLPGYESATVDQWFGKREEAGQLLVSDGRLLLLPVRSLTGASQWVTCPQLIERLGRDLARTTTADTPPQPEDPGRHAAFTSDGQVAASGDKLYLEERQFTVAGQVPSELVEALGRFIRHADVRERLRSRLVIVNDEDFGWFARYGLPINARNRLDETKQSRNLWYEETLPPDTVMHTLVMRRGDDPHEVLGQLFAEDDPYLQVGGNETVGHGWFAVAAPAGEAVGAR